MCDVIHFNQYTQLNHLIHLYEVVAMREIRTSLPQQLHKQLKEEAARDGLYLKELIVRILQEHVKKQNAATAEKIWSE